MYVDAKDYFEVVKSTRVLAYRPNISGIEGQRELDSICARARSRAQHRGSLESCQRNQLVLCY